MSDDRLQKQIEFILEIGRLKGILRRSYLADGTRRENSAEHSWHLAMMALVLSEYANGEVDVMKVMKMVLIHDIVEIDAGDTYAYDSAAQQDQARREQAAADRLFNLLPADQAAELRALWDEFEARQTPDARFAKALDHLMPTLQNISTQGKSWREGAVNHTQVIAYNHKMSEGSAVLWSYVKSLLDEAVTQGHLEA